VSSYEAVVKRNLAIIANQSASKDTEAEKVVKVLVYSGDNDVICPTVGTQRWMFELPHESVCANLSK
jgi:hypothetical protein